MKYIVYLGLVVSHVVCLSQYAAETSVVVSSQVSPNAVGTSVVGNPQVSPMRLPSLPSKNFVHTASMAPHYVGSLSDLQNTPLPTTSLTSPKAKTPLSFARLNRLIHDAHDQVTKVGDSAPGRPLCMR